MPKIKKIKTKEEKNTIKGFDVTCPEEKNNKDDIIKFLKENANYWVFQLEAGESGYKHYQIRLRLRKASTVGCLGKKLADYELKGHASITSEGVYKKKNFVYVMKPEGRIEGPWADKDEAEEEKCCIKITDAARQHYEQIGKTLKNWQARIVQLAITPDNDNIDIIIDYDGMQGKSTICCYMLMRGYSIPIPCMNDITKLVGFVAKFSDAKCFTADIPRSYNKKGKQLNEYFAGLEQIKTGLLYEWRYTTSLTLMKRPNIILFTNNDLPKECLTKKRMRAWKIVNDDLVLIPKD